MDIAEPRPSGRMIVVVVVGACLAVAAGPVIAGRPDGESIGSTLGGGLGAAAGGAIALL